MSNSNEPRKSTNPRINSELLRQAKELGINLSQTLEQRLTEIVRTKREQRWLMENREALKAYNRRIERSGVFSEGLRRF